MTSFILDFETTGLNPYHHDIIDIGCKILNEETQFTCLVRPKTKRLIEPFITNLTGITNRLLVKEGKEYLQSYQDFINFIFEHSNQESPIYIISHNGDTFDFILFKMILSELVSQKLLTKDHINSYDFKYIDTLPFAKRLLPNRRKYSLQSLSSTYNIEQINAHRAYPDVLTLEELYNILLSTLSSKINNEISPQDVIEYIQVII
jgi:DNA polymerase III alpha subunit (gram-positive type)